MSPCLVVTVGVAAARSAVRRRRMIHFAAMRRGVVGMAVRVLGRVMRIVARYRRMRCMLGIALRCLRPLKPVRECRGAGNRPHSRHRQQQKPCNHHPLCSHHFLRHPHRDGSLPAFADLYCHVYGIEALQIELRSLHLAIQLGKLGVKVNKCASELFAMARVGGGIQVILYANTGEAK